MSADTKKLKDVIKAAPTIPNATAKSVVLTDGNGNLNKVDSAAFCRMFTASFPHGGGVIKITQLQSVLIAIRTTIGIAATLVYISTYNSGTKNRLVHKFITNYPGYKFYINGNSESEASIYVESVLTDQSVTMRVIPLDGASPIFTTVASIPADATPILAG